RFWSLWRARRFHRWRFSTVQRGLTNLAQSGASGIQIGARIAHENAIVSHLPWFKSSHTSSVKQVRSSRLSDLTRRKSASTVMAFNSATNDGESEKRSNKLIIRSFVPASQTTANIYAQYKQEQDLEP